MAFRGRRHLVRALPLLLILALGLFYVFVIKDSDVTYQNAIPFKHVFTDQNQSSTGVNWGQKNYSVFTETCRIPLLNPFDASLNGLWKKVGDVPCKGLPPLIVVDQNANRITVDQDLLMRYYKNITSCSFHNFALKKGQDYETWHNSTEVDLPLYTSVVVTHEFIEVRCYAWNHTAYKQHVALIQRKPEIIKQKQAIREKAETTNKPAEVLNVVIIATDSTSRLNFARQCPRTRDYLLRRLGGFEMLGYNKVAVNTNPNMIPFFTGLSKEELGYRGLRHKMQVDSPDIQPPIPFIWKKYSEKGFLTLYSEDWHELGTFQNYGCGGFREQPTDYYWRNFAVVAEAKEEFPEYCLNGEQMVKAQVDYAKQFLRKNTDLYKFLFTFNSRTAHDATDNLGKYESIYEQFLLEMHAEGQLNNTLLVFMGDHGARDGKMRRQTFVGMLEDNMPLMILVFPKWFLNKYPDVSRALSINTRRLATHYDMHATLEQLLSFSGKVSREETPERGHSLLGELSEKRTCQNIGIPDQFCSCNEYRPTSVTDQRVKDAGNAMVKHINHLLKKERRCYRLTFLQIESASMGFKGLKLDSNKKDVSKSQVLEYQIVMTVLPSRGAFEAIMSYDFRLEDFKVIGNPVRVNRYGNQSACIDNAVLKPYCLCKL